MPRYLARQYDQLPPALAMKVLLQFDKAISAALANRVKSRLSFKVRLPAPAFRGMWLVMVGFDNIPVSFGLLGFEISRA